MWWNAGVHGPSLSLSSMSVLTLCSYCNDIISGDNISMLEPQDCISDEKVIGGYEKDGQGKDSNFARNGSGASKESSKRD